MSDIDLTKNLNTLIRINTEHDFADAISLAKKVLPHSKLEIDHFSLELFAIAALYVVYRQKKPSLKSVLECLVDPEFGTEQKMLRAISKINQFAVSESKRSFYEAFNKSIAGFSEGVAERKVMSCYAGWRKAFNLPEKLSTRKIKTPIDFPVLYSIRIDTRYEMKDATALAAAVLNPVKNIVDSIMFDFSFGLFIAVSLDVARNMRQPVMKEIVNYLLDPNWDSYKQMITHIGNGAGTKNKKTMSWITSWRAKLNTLSDQRLKFFIERAHILWVKAFSEILKGKSASSRPKGKPSIGIQVFNLDAIGKAMQLNDGINDGKKNLGEKMLQLAQENNGYRALPDAKKASLVLERAKIKFENLLEPICHLQTSLALAAAMDPKNFRVTPILLLGDPGIGKTYLAMELAKGLDGSMEKLSAGGVQGGFQLTGSHSTVMSARPGSLFRCLAESKTTSPVLVIDEVDKIVDSQYPVTPVLLDLFEPDTARIFRDEFFEMEFDASRIIAILTANSIEDVPLPLLSRLEVFEVPRPKANQRLRIIQGEGKQLRADTGKQIRLDKATSQQLAERIDIDLRKTTRLVRDAFSKAMMANEKIARLIIPKHENENRRSIGF